MKKLMLFLGLMGIVVLSHAAEKKDIKPSFNQETVISTVAIRTIPVPLDTREATDCEMSASLSVNIGVVRIETTCKASGATCEQALATAQTCVTAFIKRISSVIK